MYTKMPFLLLVLLLLPVPCTADALEYDRSEFGNSPFPIWSRLTPFEIATLEDIPAARAADADALLAVYLLASGDARHWEDFDHYREQIDDWLVAQEVPRDPGQSLRTGYRLFLGMHERFLDTRVTPGSVPHNYRAEQSQLSQVFESGTFNCISSALLYSVIAHKAGLRAEGVVLPTHAFVQLRLDDGELVEIETTSLSGYNTHHDEAFYEANARDWYTERELPPPSYSDYLERKVVSAYELGLFNMNNQHTGEQRMHHMDRMRLAELRAHLLPADAGAQKARLAYYYQEFVALSERGDFPRAAHMYQQVEPYLRQLEHPARADIELAGLLTAVQAQMAEALVRGNRQEQGLELARRLLQSRDLGAYPFDLENYLFAILSRYAVDKAEQADYQAARSAFSALEAPCVLNKLCSSGMAQVYSTWAMHYFQDRNWARTVDVYQEYLSLDSSSAMAGHMAGNLEKAYVNWASVEQWEGEWESAAELLELCLQRVDAAPRCQAALDAITEKQRAGYL